MNDVIPITGKLEPLPLKELNIRFVPMARLHRWYTDMSLPNSLHVKLLQQYIDFGTEVKIDGEIDKPVYSGVDLMNFLLKGDYAEERRMRRVEFKQEKWSEKWIKKHIKIRIGIYESMKERGFVAEGKPVMVLKEPFWKTRFNYPGIEGFEIWNGAGRCAAAYVLGWETIPGLWVADTRPGACECEKIMRKYPK